MYIYPYHTMSKSASRLAKELNCLRIKHSESTYVAKKGDVIINWGSSALPDRTEGATILNKPRYVEIAICKDKFFKHQQEGDARLPEFTTEKVKAKQWVMDGKMVVGRQQVKGRQGAGIVFSDDVSGFDLAKFFTLYVPKTEEYRVNVAFGKVIDVLKKVLGSTYPDGTPIDKDNVEWRVRSYANGFIEQRQNIFPDPDVLNQALLAMKQSGLDFGGVDVIWNSTQKKAYVLEINTAPALEGPTLLGRYGDAFRTHIAELEAR